MNVGDKIRRLRKRRRMTQKELADKIGVKPTAVSAWETGLNRPLMDKIMILANLFNVSPDYFYGNPYEPDESDYDVKETESFYQSNNTINVPIIAQVSCGKGIIAFKEITGYEKTPADWIQGGEYFYVRAKGDSMINARIMNGDLLLIRRQDEVENGEIAAISIDDEVFLKRVFINGDRFILQSENPAYQPIIFSKEDDKNIHIIGKLKKIVISI